MENGGASPPTTSSNNSSTELEPDSQPPLTGRVRAGSASSGHKRTLSGTLLSKLSFLRMSQASEHDPGSLSPKHRWANNTRLHQDENDEIDNVGVDGGGGGARASSGRAMATVMQQRKMRRRRGSLRKTALLGTRLELKEKRNNSSSARSEDAYGSHNNALDAGNTTPKTSLFKPTITADDEVTPRVSIENTQTPTPASYWPRSLMMMRGASLTTSTHQQNYKPTARRSLVSDTTDDEDDISIPRFNNESAATANLRPSSVSSSGSGLPAPIATPSSSSESYFAILRQPAATAADSMALQMARNSSHRARSPLATHSSIEIANHHTGVDGGWDYSETEWWGWIILIVTWLVFVVGIGSSFGVWSWAWDVGETPYAPPELEDDPTLPIVGYYPALMVLTAVMAWVWVVVAWVGMKYFKHANISGDDG
ncbi:hypothetical protein BGW36DRAFT_370555 [Talaromyces proteolyticus]|uniref:Uncharacterized protein n=1 Tax=Talaromyces proteolyticus TaxID=1131652 RepID=A0AAD4Q5D8_9EURO|nr:uncharacterized protein BGW36DRAFT_370555 [Talaromyces proteolyticus]KAH8704089.1 hypothetical protein BGW36DRAFT_370555 [Talaromyces proteolyticus]